MREMTKILLCVCTVCAVGASRDARAQSAQPPGQNPPSQSPPPTVPPPIPTDTPAPTQPNKPGDVPADPNVPAPTSTPTTSPVSDPNAPVPPVTDPNAPAPPVPDTAPTGTTPVTSSTTTTTTTTTTTSDDDVAGEELYSWHEPLLSSGIGVSTILGGGVGGFTDKQMRSTTSDIGGLWDLRVAIGSHLPLALEVGYMGSATNINGLPTGNKGRLIGTTIEGDLRYNILPHMPFTPYVFAGMGWQRYDVTNTSVSLADSGVADHDNLMVFPLGAGLAYRLSGFVVDVRGTFRVATDNDLVLTNPALTQPTPNDFAPMHSWEASAAVGYEF